MIEARDIFKNTAALAIALLIERISAVFLTLFISRRLGAAGLGVYSATLGIYGVIALVVEMGAMSFVIREVAQDRSRTNHYVLHLGLMSIAAAALITALGLLIVPHLGCSAELAISVSVAILAIVPGALNTIQEAVFVAHQRVHFQTYTTVLAAVLNTALSLALLARGHGIVSIIIVFVATKSIMTVCYFFFLNRYIIRLHWEFQRSSSLILLHNIKSYAASSMLGGLFARPEIIILALVRGDAHAGYYTAALKLVDLCYLLPDTYMTNVFPALSRFHRERNEKFQDLQQKSVKYLLASSLPLAVVMTVAAEPILKLLYGPGFQSSVPVLRILAWNLPLYCMNGMLWRVLVARGEQSSNVRVQSITACTRLASGYILISSFAHLGAACASMANLLLHNCLLSLYIKSDGTRLHTIVVAWRFAIIALMTGFMVHALMERIELWILAPVAALVYISLAVLFKAFSPEDLDLFRRVIPSRLARRDA
jgi:O-antigen/teichoic acid export membrane protein